MVLLSVFGLIVIFLWIAFQDFRDREISIFLLTFYGIWVGIYGLVVHRSWIDLVLNLSFICTLLGITLLLVAFIFKKKHKEVIGLGDVLFLIISIPLFQFASFVIWLNIGLVISFVFHTFLRRYLYANLKHQTIPLAGLLSVVFAIALLTESYIKPLGDFIY